MNLHRYSLRHFSHRFSVVAIVLFACLASGVFPEYSFARSATPAPAVTAVAGELNTNGQPAELASVQQLLTRLERAATARDANALRFYGVEPVATSATIQAQIRTTHIGFSPTGALVRQVFRISTTPGAPVSTLAHEFWLTRRGNDEFAFSNKRWSAPYDAVTALQEAAREYWNDTAASPQSPFLIQLVAARRGGRWIALRRSRWDGVIFDATNLARVAQSQNIPQGSFFDSTWLRAQMNAAPREQPGVGHFVFQKSSGGWVGIGMAWEIDRKLSRQSDQAATAARQEVLGPSYGQPNAHRALGIALAQIGLFQEAADELEKADALQAGIVDAALLKQVRDAKPNDPENLAITQLKNEERVGLDPHHPSYLVSALKTDYQNQPSVLRALRLGQEYSRLGYDSHASEWLQAAQQLAERGAMSSSSASDRQWIQVLSEHLEERRALSPVKPPNTIRSPLFTLRCRLNDLSAVQILASLEAAQHTVYADFGIPMGSTEVLLWRTQSEFQNYVTRFSAQGNSEFVAALTLTKLIATRQGPVVLGEEINVFTDSRTGVFSTVAHEYGHVAVRQLSRGRDVPTWFNEGVATSVEGGYDGYLPRVKGAAEARRLLPMDEMLQWDVDGERAFLAYSQANSLIDYIVATWGKEAVLNILRRIGSDQKPEAAFQSVLGISQQELWNRWARDGIH